MIIVNTPEFRANANTVRKVDPFIWESGGRSREKSTIKAGHSLIESCDLIIRASLRPLNVIYTKLRTAGGSRTYTPRINLSLLRPRDGNFEGKSIRWELTSKLSIIMLERTIDNL